MKNQQLLDDLRLEIKQELAKITKVNSPIIWSKIHDSKNNLNMKSYLRIEALIIKKIIAEELTPSAAIPQLEQELDFR